MEWLLPWVEIPVKLIAAIFIAAFVKLVLILGFMREKFRSKEVLEEVSHAVTTLAIGLILLFLVL